MSIPLLSNPLTNPLFRPLALILLCLFTLAILALFILHIKRRVSGELKPGAMEEKILWQRLMTWAAIAVLFMGANFGGPLTMALLCAFLSWKGAAEYARLTQLARSQQWALTLGGWLTIAGVLLYGVSVMAIAPIVAFFAWSLLALWPAREEAEPSTRFTLGMKGLWGYLYLGWLPAFLVALRLSKTPGLILAASLGVALSDVGAFCVGKALRGPKLAPHLSPNKTWSGVLGNILGAGLALTLVAFAFPTLPWWQRLAFILAIGLGSVWGDLLESLLKRQSGVKDAGAFLPGFGGLLDRIDSLLFVTPLIYYLSRFFIH